MADFSTRLGKLLCWCNLHDFRVLSKSFAFGTNMGVEKVECRRCGIIVTRAVQSD